jgi:hypothetical protein
MVRWAISLVALACATMAQAAEPQPIPAKAGKAWQHKASGFAFPPAIGDFKRDDIKDLSSGKQIDLGSAYRDPDSGTLATVYLYRPAMPSASLWFDVANWYILRNDRFKPVTVERGPATFAITGQSQTANLRQVYAIGAGGRSSGVAVIPMGRWLVKIRITSAAYEPRALDQVLESFVRSLGWPAKMPTARDSTPVESCSGKLPEAKAEEISQTGALILVGATIPSLIEEQADKGELAEMPRLCRDDSRTDMAYPVYQFDEGKDGYAVAIGDNGTLLAARHDDLSASVAKELNPGGQNGPGFYRVTLMSAENWEQYPAFAQLPPIEQAFETVRAKGPLSVTAFTGKGTKITLDQASFK